MLILILISETLMFSIRNSREWFCYFQNSGNTEEFQKGCNTWFFLKQNCINEQTLLPKWLQQKVKSSQLTELQKFLPTIFSTQNLLLRDNKGSKTMLTATRSKAFISFDTFA